MDDRLARAHAERRGLKVAGTLNVLELAAQRQLLDLADAVRSLKATSFHIADDVVAGILKPGNP